MRFVKADSIHPALLPVLTAVSLILDKSERILNAPTPTCQFCPKTEPAWKLYHCSRSQL